MIPEKWRPHNYQKQAIAFGVGQACAGFFYDPGLGKTAIMLAIYKLVQKLVGKMLVIAPLRVCQSVWPQEVAKWTDFQHLKVTVLHGPHKARRLHDDADIFVINPEGLEWLSKHRMEDLGIGMLVVDESTKFKHTDTLRFRTLKSMLNSFRRRYILTGSPAPNGLLDLFGQVYILDGGAALGKYVTHYRTNYFQNPQTGNQYDKYKWVIKPDGEEAIYAKLKPLVQRAAAADYLELPELVENIVNVTLPEKAMKTYRQMENAMIAALETETVVADNAAAATNKCRQIANGGIYHEDGEAWTHVHEAKLDAVEDLIEELQGKPALVAYEYKHDLDRLRKRLGDDVPYIGGGVPASVFRDLERRWNAGEIPILLAQPQSVAHGLNLQGTGAAVIWHSLTWDLEIYEQFIRRVWRQGQKERVFLHHIIAKGTVDEVIIKMLHAKDKTQRALLDALKTSLNRRSA